MGADCAHGEKGSREAEKLCHAEQQPQLQNSTALSALSSSPENWDLSNCFARKKRNLYCPPPSQSLQTQVATAQPPTPSRNRCSVDNCGTVRLWVLTTVEEITQKLHFWAHRETKPKQLPSRQQCKQSPTDADTLVKSVYAGEEVAVVVWTPLGTPISLTGVPGSKPSFSAYDTTSRWCAPWEESGDGSHS